MGTSHGSVRGEHDRPLEGEAEQGLDLLVGQRVRVAEICTGQEVSLSRRLVANTVAEVRLALHDILGRGVGDLLIHLAQAEVSDAAGLSVIVGVFHRARRVGRQLVLVDVSPHLDRLLRASRLKPGPHRWADRWCEHCGAFHRVSTSLQGNTSRYIQRYVTGRDRSLQ